MYTVMTRNKTDLGDTLINGQDGILIESGHVFVKGTF